MTVNVYVVGIRLNRYDPTDPFVGPVILKRGARKRPVETLDLLSNPVRGCPSSFV